MASIIDYHNGIVAIDANYMRPGIAAIHLVIEGGQVAIIDTGINASVPAVINALDGLGLSVDQVSYVILTHIHLDHAGGCGTLMQHLPNAKVVVHSRGGRHLIDPSRLIAGTKAVYGDLKTAELYGEIMPISSDRVIEASHQHSLSLNGRALLLLETPGHALHHICIVDQGTGHIFSGDTFGVSYRQLDNAGQQYIFATTTPVHFDPEALHRSVDLLASYRPDAIYLTHYSQVRDIPRLADQLKTCINAHVDIAYNAPGVGQVRIDHIAEQLKRWVHTKSRSQNWGLQGNAAVQLLAMDIELNAQGLNVWRERQG